MILILGMRRILIAGVGDKLRRDDGFGSRVVEELSKLSLPRGIELRDYGLRSLDLLQDIEEFDCVILVDVVDGGGRAGELYVFEPSIDDLDEEEIFKSILSLHEVKLTEVFALGKALKVLPKKVIIVGCQPKDLSIGLGLTKEVEESVKTAVKVILKKIKELRG